MCRPFHFQVDGNFQTVAWADARYVHGGRFIDDVELHFLLQAIARYVRLHLGYHSFDAFFHFFLVGGLRQDEHGVAHNQRRFGRVQNNNGLAPFGTAQFFDGVARGFGKLIDVGTGTRPGRFAGNRGDDFRIVHFGHLRHGSHNGNGGLATARDHVHVGGVLRFQVQRRNNERANGGRG